MRQSQKREVIIEHQPPPVYGKDLPKNVRFYLIKKTSFDIFVSVSRSLSNVFGTKHRSSSSINDKS
jgi:hypothetical protein